MINKIIKTFESWADNIETNLVIEDYIALPKNNVVCRNCGKKQTIHQNEKHITFLCKCGCRIYYPPNNEGLVITKFISKEEHEASKNGRRK